MNLYANKIQVIHSLKNFLEDRGFQEVLTPTLRKDQGNLISRIPLVGGSALRDSHELQLRCLLSLYPCVYEIGSCFREEDGTKADTNAKEFLLMELFSSKHTLADLEDFVRLFILQYRPDTIFLKVSVAEQIRKDFGIDLFHESQEELYRVLRQRYPEKSFKNDYEYVLHYIEAELEPLSKGTVIFFTEYPECTCSYANILQGSVISRFELFADNKELANAFDDECSAYRFIERNKSLPIFPEEETVIAQSLHDGNLPANSAGLGIGIERLCMFLFDREKISDFNFPVDGF